MDVPSVVCLVVIHDTTALFAVIALVPEQGWLTCTCLNMHTIFWNYTLIRYFLTVQVLFTTQFSIDMILNKLFKTIENTSLRYWKPIQDCWVVLLKNFTSISNLIMYHLCMTIPDSIITVMFVKYPWDIIWGI